MNDTHGVTGEGWYAFDLDGTLAVYDKWQGIDHIGEPVKPMVELIKKMHAEGKIVKILTARVAPRPEPETATTRYPLYAGEGGDVPEYVARICVGLDPKEQRVIAQRYGKSVWTAEDFIVDWCWENLGFVPEITHEKDHLMLELYDDRVKQVVPNKGGPRRRRREQELSRRGGALRGQHEAAAQGRLQVQRFYDWVHARRMPHDDPVPRAAEVLQGFVARPRALPEGPRRHLRAPSELAG